MPSTQKHRLRLSHYDLGALHFVHESLPRLRTRMILLSELTGFVQLFGHIRTERVQNPHQARWVHEGDEA